MPIIANLDTFQQENVLYNSFIGAYEFKILNPVPSSQQQNGQFCKLNALSMVLNWLHHTQPDLPKPPPVRKSYGLFQENDATTSLREIAKKQHGSQVGEVYDPFTLMAIARQSGYADLTLITPCTPSDYIETLINAVNAHEAPIVFFDVNVKTGDVIQANGKWEHAAVIVGYFTTKENKPGFILAQWGQYHWCHANDLALSAGQLSLSRQAETFYKFKKNWKEHEAIAEYEPYLLFQKADKVRVANAPTHNGGFRNAILIVSNKKKQHVKMLDNEQEHLFTDYLMRQGPLKN
ncbi:hypothetical protein [Aquicella lusitana]|uniref:Peptidase C39-like domain-containing protein n=1 Tax=Aquicella lusitana TaxID=254246 RepID=A0A370GTX9_9COXI|nr:hypothetical protein [Aquicella lusitana]RDI46941.1 hypothetical protein C8D86_10464 [Aquicella lusitana]VVC73831.1 hypothetical protein AQULUS_15810 [Aquicella lusitana]